MKDKKMLFTLRIDEKLLHRIEDNQARIKDKYGSKTNFYIVAIEKEFAEFTKNPYDKSTEILDFKKIVKSIEKKINKQENTNEIMLQNMKNLEFNLQRLANTIKKTKQTNAKTTNNKPKSKYNQGYDKNWALEIGTK